MGVWLWHWDYAAVFAVEFAKFTTTEKRASSLQKCQVQIDSFFFDIQDIVHKEFVPFVQTANGKFYCEILKRLRKGILLKILDKLKNNNWFFHHDNAPAHTSFVVQRIHDFQKHYSDFPLPPYLPKVAPATFSYFPR
jgi:hypothetical protein